MSNAVAPNAADGLQRDLRLVRVIVPAGLVVVVELAELEVVVLAGFLVVLRVGPLVILVAGLAGLLYGVF